MAGLFVSFEGIDRAGKTTQAQLLCEALGARALAVREPGGTAVGERVRDLLKSPDTPIGVRTEALLFAAARAELVSRVVRPALEADRIVVCDRFRDSSLAYQGRGRRLGVEAVARINEFATDGLAPDLTLLLWIDPADAASRAGVLDRFEREGSSLQREVLLAYEALARAEPERIKKIAADRLPEEVHADVLAEVETALEGVTA